MGEPEPRNADTFTVLVWNMQHRPANWKVLSAPMVERSVAVALINEASVPVDQGFLKKFPTIYAPKTEGLNTYRNGKPWTRSWSTAVVSAHGRPEGINARAKGLYGRRPNIRFAPSRPGSWTAGVVEIPWVGPVTCISLYGLMDELSDASQSPRPSPPPRWLRRSPCAIDW
jgi:hypothetical protein